MKDRLSIDTKKKTKGECYTSAEILRQPETWENVAQQIFKRQDTILNFLSDPISHDDLQILLTGAGSSAFMGNVVAKQWQRNTSRKAEAIPTTDLVTHFKDHVLTDHPLLLISFARSGNSPESTAVIEKANKYCEQAYHLIITCNPNGKLAKLKDQENTFIFLLPSEAEDQSLAMTNSFTSMALSATLIPKLINSKSNYLQKQVSTLSEYGTRLINDFHDDLNEAAKLEFDRVVFLGSGPLLGIARESHLKVQELTNGEVIGKYDSFLGFRHGPKAIIDDDTLLVYLLSNEDYTSQYEYDLIEQVNRHNINLHTIGISETDSDLDYLDFNISINNRSELEEGFWAIACTLPSQIIGFYKSILLGYNPDNPSPDGTISRVVEGVHIYDDSPELKSKR
ncbi:SIS domain-containing protein [Fodinibius sp. Rm-B-1B1-1]|uniref:SIS domain-containing protein n=1 Tax=Fodinibius alkaliphilus TaxID=3140241 RepID=UPI00315A42D6